MSAGGPKRGPRPPYQIPMKTNIISLVMAACALVLAVSGCGKKDEAAAPSTPPAPASASETVKKALTNAQSQTEVLKQKVDEVKTNAQAQATALQSQAQGLLDQAKTLVAQKKWSEALALLNQLGGQSLTSEQKTLVQTLKDQAQKAIEAATKAKVTEEAAKAVGGLVPPK